ncbi:amidohydrolase [Streptomyces sp. NPDC004629]|uniref:amidohydrolase n=1 Tax=Streptomyces sp. NPDC004629 TaxID=3364705 RepID=UPI0036C619B8
MTQPHDVRVVNANVLTMDPRQPRAEAIGFRDGIITAVGSTESVPADGRNTRTVDMAGATIVPGLIDAHSHLDLMAYAWEIATDCRSSRVDSIDGIVDALCRTAARTPAGTWVMGMGEHYQNHKLAEGRYPDKHDLDRVSTTHPVMYRASYHLNVFNSLGLELLGVDDDTPDAPGGRIERDPLTREATGRTYDMFSPLGGPQPAPAELAEGIRRVQERYLSVGVTALGDIVLHAEGLDALMDVERSGGLVLRASLYPKLPVVASARDVASGRLAERFAGLDPDRLRLSGVKIFLDGGLTAGAAALYEDYPGQPGYRGELAYRDEEVRELVRTADEAGLQIAIHAIGDRALDQAIEAIEALGDRRRGAPRHRIEHAGNMFMTKERIDRLVTARIVPVPQPAFLRTTAPGYIKHLGRDRIGPVMPFRTLIDQGLPVPGNSDAIGITADQHHPFPAMQTAVTRRVNDGEVLEADEAVSVEEALRMYTTWAAYSLGREAELGSLSAGKAADFAVLSRDPTEVPADEIGALTVASTWIAGREVYQAP